MESKITHVKNKTSQEIANSAVKTHSETVMLKTMKVGVHVRQFLGVYYNFYIALLDSFLLCSLGLICCLICCGFIPRYSKGSVPTSEDLLKTTSLLLFLQAAAKMKRPIYSHYW